jgi:hypothetical protein
LSEHDRNDPWLDRMTATSTGHPGMHTPRAVVLAGCLVAALASLWITCWASTPLAAAATVTPRPCSAAALLSCTQSLAIAHTSDNEATEPEEELEEGSEEAATAEAEAEAEEGDSEEGGSSSERSAPGDVLLSGLRLTANATTALEHHHPLASAIGFSFTLSTAAKVQVTLLEQTDAYGHTGWVALPDSLSLNAKQGRVSHELRGHNRLTPGRYRLTLDPSGGRARAIYLDARR